MIKPDFFIVGAPKCGTTAMYQYLKAHPEVFMPAYKEPHYFAEDFHGAWIERFRQQEDYLRLFADAGKAKRVGEASTWHLYSRCAARKIHEFNPEACIIIMLRSPVDMLYSLYQQFCYTLDENLPSFEEALAAEERRKQGADLPPTLQIMPEALFYQETVKFTEQVSRYLEVFGREQVHIIIYDDLKAETRAVYQQTLEFLNIDTRFEPDFNAVNASKYPRNAVIQRFLMRPPAWVMAAGKAVLPLARPLYWKLRGMNSRHEARPPLDPALRSQLQREFLPEVERLSQLLGRDLTHWCHG